EIRCRVIGSEAFMNGKRPVVVIVGGACGRACARPGHAPGDDHGSDSAADGTGEVRQSRMLTPNSPFDIFQIVAARSMRGAVSALAELLLAEREDRSPAQLRTPVARCRSWVKRHRSAMS